MKPVPLPQPRVERDGAGGPDRGPRPEDLARRGGSPARAGRLGGGVGVVEAASPGCDEAARAGAASTLGARLAEEFSAEALERSLDLGGVALPAPLWDEALRRPLADFLARPGKEFRARLVSAAWRLCGRAGNPPAELGFIVEVLHAGSLIIDDIEDDSTTRRGDVALHLRYGLPRALNAGCWLYFWPHVLLERLAAPPAIELACRRWIDAALLRAHQGQALDLSARITELDPADVPAVVATTTRLKTGALMQLAAALGAIVAGASPAQVEALATFGRDLGVGLQMLDDLGSLSCPSRAAKALEDVRGARPTWPWAWAAERVTPARFAALVEPVRALREPADAASDLAALRAVTAPLLAEVGDPGRALVHAHLQAAFTRLGATFTGPVVAPTLAAIRAEIETLEMSYG